MYRQRATARAQIFALDADSLQEVREFRERRLETSIRNDEVHDWISTASQAEGTSFWASVPFDQETDVQLAEPDLDSGSLRVLEYRERLGSTISDMALTDKIRTRRPEQAAVGYLSTAESSP